MNLKVTLLLSFCVLTLLLSSITCGIIYHYFFEDDINKNTQKMNDAYSEVLRLEEICKKEKQLTETYLNTPKIKPVQPISNNNQLITFVHVQPKIITEGELKRSNEIEHILTLLFTTFNGRPKEINKIQPSDDVIDVYCYAMLDLNDIEVFDFNKHYNKIELFSDIPLMCSITKNGLLFNNEAKSIGIVFCNAYMIEYDGYNGVSYVDRNNDDLIYRLLYVDKQFRMLMLYDTNQKKELMRCIVKLIVNKK